MSEWKLTPYQAIFFDFDGVLVDSEPIHFRCWQEVLEPFGVSLDWDSYVQNCIGVADRAMIETLCARRSPPLPFDDLWAKYPYKKQIFRERMCAGEGLPSETIRLLDRLLPYRLAVVTSSGRTEVEPVLQSAGILDRFDTVVYGDDVRRLKPAPDPYLLAAERLGVTRALVIEDSPAGIASGKAAGFDVLEIRAQAEMPGLLLTHLSSQD